MYFSRQEYLSGLPFPSPGDLPDPGIEPRSLTLQADSLLSEPPGKSLHKRYLVKLITSPCKTVLPFGGCSWVSNISWLYLLNELMDKHTKNVNEFWLQTFGQCSPHRQNYMTPAVEFGELGGWWTRHLDTILSNFIGIFYKPSVTLQWRLN